MKLYYTGAIKEGDVQEVPSLSLGGYVSSSPLPNGSINNLFGGISQLGKEKLKREVRAVVLKNETGMIVNPSVWYDNISSEPITNYRLAFAALAQDDCGWFMERIGQGDALPINATFIDPRTQANAVTLPAMTNDGYMGIWIERTFNPYAVQQSSACENLLSKFNSEDTLQVSSMQFPADVADSLDGRYFNLDTANQKFTIWFSTGAGATQPTVVGRELVKVTIGTGDIGTVVAGKVLSALNLIIASRGDVVFTIMGNVVTMTSNIYGAFPPPSDVNTGSVFTLVTQGTLNGQETIEDMNLSFSW